jgi:hypothetical protein
MAQAMARGKWLAKSIIAIATKPRFGNINGRDTADRIINTTSNTEIGIAVGVVRAAQTTSLCGAGW